MSNEDEEHVSEPNADIQGVRKEPTFDPLFLETGVPLVPFQESRGSPLIKVLRESAQSPKSFDAHTLRSKLSSYDLKLLRERCEIPPIIKLRLPDKNESSNMTTIDEIGVYWDMFVNGFRVPLHPFSIKVLNAYGLAPNQFSPHAWRFISFFIYQCHKLGDPPLFNTQGVLGDIIPDELASIHGVEEEEMQDLDFDALVSGSQPKVTETQTKGFVLGLTPLDKSKETSKKRRVSGKAGNRATSSSVRPDTPHCPTWGVSINESVFKSPYTAWDWSSHAIIPMDRKTLSGYGVTETANGMVQLMSQAMAHVQIGAEKLIAADKVLDEEKKKVMIENNFYREAEKKVEDLSKKVERLELSNTGLTTKNANLLAHVNDLEAEKSSVALQAVQLFKRSKVFLDQRLRDSKGAFVHGYNECKNDISKDHPELDMNIYEHKFAREVAAEGKNRAEEVERKKSTSSQSLTSPSMSRSLGASSPIPFPMWGMDIMVPFPSVTAQRRFVIVAIDYFTKWAEAEALDTITEKKCEDFFWRAIVCRFGIRRVLVIDNGKQFVNLTFQTFCANLSIEQRFTSVAHPQSNGQTEVINCTLLQRIKKKLDGAKGIWVDELPKILWAYNTTTRTPTRETPFSLSFGMEALIPVDIGLQSIHLTTYDPVQNEEALRANLNLINEGREQAAMPLAAYQHRVSKFYYQ
ncbi:hypothetical protein RJ639_017166 [Escallonia herrerae]|uniref:Integrase catalytic domain-containing protein n=1 Tax=Escallonia herrerae TaxID=1293975 RepID=A0AA89AK21_9ASTE|nr:hypothetical protein RJ639_017166 [Escallonia herrerae]